MSIKREPTTFTTTVWVRQDYDIQMSTFIFRIWGKRRRERFAKEVREYRERVLERDRKRIAKIISHKFKLSNKQALKLVTYYELPDSPARKVNRTPGAASATSHPAAPAEQAAEER